MKRFLTLLLAVLLIMPAHIFSAEGANPSGAQGAAHQDGGSWWTNISVAGVGLGALLTGIVVYLKSKGFLKGLNIGPIATTPETFKPQPIEKQAEEQARKALIEKYMRVVRKLGNIANTDDEIAMAKMNPEISQEIAAHENKLSDILEQRYRYTVAEEYAKTHPNQKLSIMDISYFSKVKDDKFRERYFRMMILYYRSIIRDYGSDDAKNKTEKLFMEENVQFKDGKSVNEMPPVIGEE